VESYIGFLGQELKIWLIIQPLFQVFLGTTAGLFGEFYSTSPHPLTTLYSSQVIYKEPYFHIDNN